MGNRAVPLDLGCCLHEARNAMPNKVCALFSLARRQSRLCAFLSCTPSTPSHAVDPGSSLFSLAQARPSTSALCLLHAVDPGSSLSSLARARLPNALCPLRTVDPGSSLFILHGPVPPLCFVSCALSTSPFAFAFCTRRPTSVLLAVSCMRPFRNGDGRCC